MGKYKMDLDQSYLAFELNAATELMREYQQAMLNILLSVTPVEQPSPRDWSPRTGRCLCQKHKA